MSSRLMTILIKWALCAFRAHSILIENLSFSKMKFASLGGSGIYLTKSST
jgi:hypothetical protein